MQTRTSDETIGERPVFVVGFPRSGTTLLQSILGRHPRIAAAPELYYWVRVYNLRGYHGNLDDDAVLREVIGRVLDVPFGLWSHVAIDREAVAARLQARPRTYEGLFRAVMDEFAAVCGRPRWSEKSPGQQVSQCLRLAPDAQVVHIVRGVEDVVVSSLDMPWHSRSARDVAHRWTRFNLRAVQAGAAAGPESYLRVRYEDLVRSPEMVLRLVTTFLGEDYDAAMLQATASTAVSRVSRGWQSRAEQEVAVQPRRRRLSTYECALVAAASGRVGPTLGYASSRRDRVVGHLLEVATSPARLPARARRWWRERGAKDPSVRARLVEELLEQQRRELGVRDVL